MRDFDDWRMETANAETDALAQLRAHIETYLQQPDGDTFTADRAAALLRTVGRCIADRAWVIESEEHDLAAATTWATGLDTEERGKQLIGGYGSWRQAFVNPDQHLMDAWKKERGRYPEAPRPNWDEIDWAALAARYDDLY